MPLDLTIAIPAKNEGAHLLGCLEAIGGNFAQQVVVIDSGSSDATCQIARDWGASVVQFQWNGQFPKKRNWFLREHRPSTTWVLFLDADEFLTDDFKSELATTLPSATVDGFWLRYSIYFLGRELQHGYPLNKLALLRVGAGEYERIDEQAWSHLDMEVHEHPILAGPVGQIRAKIDHRDTRDVSHYIAKHNDYSTWEAKRLHAKRQQAEHAPLTWRQRVKYRLVTSPLGGLCYFFGSYVLMLGFLDGSRGFVFAILKMAYFTQVYCKWRELQSRELGA